MKTHLLFAKQLRKKYQGQYVAVTQGKVVASGRSAPEAFRLARELLGGRKRKKRVEGVYYVPRREDLLTALCVFRISA